ncbi:SERINE/ARGININE RICH SPLICING FACTOR [Salix purpurea]|uniref:SERINE/ARGININE RICH SPLICING FACTOR n=1 Tax=Salix purpurea TaxID=77065 RepID=A0A9Q0TXT6_SALPP|nr:SERINE/ARGININE RICH SPLICING FACTOR [Salix purpurea]
MSRYRSRSRSYSPGRRSRTPPRARKRYDDEDRHLDTRSYRDRRSSAPSGLLIRNLSLDARPEDLRGPFEKFGPLKDIYLPRNYHTREPRGFGFVKYRYGEDAAEAKRQMNHKSIGGREISIVFAEENRKTPQEMCRTIRTSNRHGGSHSGRTPPGFIRQQYRSYSRPPSPGRHDSRDRGVKEDYCSPQRSRSISRSRSPQDERNFRADQQSRSPKERNHASRGSRTLRANSHSPSRSHSQSYGFQSMDVSHPSVKA